MLCQKDGLTMSTVQEIELAIDTLSPEERERLSAWMDERYPQPIDTQLKADLSAGRFDESIRRTLEEHASGKTRAL
jgi:hypothetical protein